jgi:malonyl-CoA O-methyltransferase
VHDFIDIHDLGSALSRTGFQEPVLDVDRVIRRYRDPGALMRELQSIGARNASSARARGLTGRDKFRRMLAAYDAESPRGGNGDPANPISATFEIIYGAAWAAQAGRGEFAVPADSLRVRQRP